MRVLWTHNFDPAIANNLVFIDSLATSLVGFGIDLQLEYLGNLRSISGVLDARAKVREMAASFDLVHAQFGSACAVATSAAVGVPKVLSIRGSDWNVHSASLNFLFFHTRVAALLTRASLGSYDRILAVSSRVKHQLEGFAPSTKIGVLPSPIDLEKFVPVDRMSARRLLGFPQSRAKWVLFNSLNIRNPIKRFWLAKKAVEIARQRIPDIAFRIATDMPHDKLPLFVAACDLILCTSDNEGWPNSVKEALACNVPFVSTDVSDLRLIADVEPSCRVCRADAALIARNICEVLEQPPPLDLRRYVLPMGQQRIGADLAAVYEELIGQERTGGDSGRAR